MAALMDDPDYHSGDDFDLEFVGHRFGFSADDFSERVSAAAVRLGLVDARELDDEESADLLDLATNGGPPVAPRSGLGRYLARRWDQVGTHEGQSLVYWLRKLVFRSAWLDHRVKLGLLDVRFDERAADFRYGRPGAERPLVEIAGHPTWSAVGYRRRSAR
jgi:hypothetical protein